MISRLNPRHCLESGGVQPNFLVRPFPWIVDEHGKGPRGIGAAKIDSFSIPRSRGKPGMSPQDQAGMPGFRASDNRQAEALRRSMPEFRAVVLLKQ
jgi:hypothetical protein